MATKPEDLFGALTDRIDLMQSQKKETSTSVYIRTQALSPIMRQMSGDKSNKDLENFMKNNDKGGEDFG